jgi:hypothetical protein
MPADLRLDQLKEKIVTAAVDRARAKFTLDRAAPDSPNIDHFKAAVDEAEARLSVAALALLAVTQKDV